MPPVSGRPELALPRSVVALVALLSLLSFPRGVLPGGEPLLDAVRGSGVRGGLVVLLSADSEPEAIARRAASLRGSESRLVQTLVRDPVAAAAARDALARRGLLGPVSVRSWSERQLPYADGIVRLLVAERLPADLPATELLRALTPRGVALLRVEGAWTPIEKPSPPDIDEWTHFLHGPDNNAVAEDTRVGPPRHLQWVAGPRYARSHDHLSSVSCVVSAAGRIVYVIDEGPAASVTEPPRWRLVARDAFSGVLLWKRDLTRWEDPLRPFRSGPAELPRRLVAIGDRVWATLGYGEPVSALDAATGEVVRTYEGTENTHEIIASSGKLFLVVSDPLGEESPTTGRVVRRLQQWRGAYDEFVTEYAPKHLRVLDAESGDLEWKLDGPVVRNLLPLTLLVAEGRVFFQNESDVIALDAGSGREAWRAPRPSPRRRYAWLTPTLVVKDGVVLSADRAAASPVDTGGEASDRLEWRVSSNHELTHGDLIAYSSQTGERLWSARVHEGFNAPVDVLVADGRVWSGTLAWGRQPGITEVLDLHTGRVVSTRSPDQKRYTLGFGHARCYRHKATSRYVLLGRAGIEFVDMSADRVVADHWVRGACQYGILPANGLIYAPQHSCACYITAKLDGFNALSGRRARPAAEEPDRTERGPAFDAVPLVPEDPSAWSTYRGGPARGGSAAGAIGSDPGLVWERPLGGELTAVVAAGGLVLVAQREAHTVHALRARDGEPVWRFTAEGRVDSPPTVHRGRAFFGSADGWMYCLRAADGALVWRARIAPEERQIVSYEQLESTWPVPGSVLIRPAPGDPSRSIAWAVGGRTSFVDGGLHLCGVDAGTGEIIHRRRISHRDPETGEEPQDQVRGVNMPGAMPDVLSSDGTSMFLRHLRLDLEGRVQPTPVDHLYSSAGFLDATWWHRTYLQVGREMRGGYGGWMHAGRQKASGRVLVRRGSTVWGFGRTDYSQTGSHLGLQSSHRLFAAELREAPATTGRKGRTQPGGGLRPETTWARSIPFYPRAMLVAGDVLVIAGPERIADFEAARPEGRVWLWTVSARDGTTLYEHALAAAPVHDSLAAADGRLWLATVDGRVECWR